MLLLAELGDKGTKSICARSKSIARLGNKPSPGPSRAGINDNCAGRLAIRASGQVVTAIGITRR